MLPQQEKKLKNTISSLNKKLLDVLMNKKLMMPLPEECKNFYIFYLYFRNNERDILSKLRDYINDRVSVAEEFIMMK